MELERNEEFISMEEVFEAIGLDEVSQGETD